MGCSYSKRPPEAGSERCRMLSMSATAQAHRHQHNHIVEELTEEQMEELWPKFIEDMDITADRAQDLAALDTDKKMQALQNWLSSKQPGEATSTAGYYVAQLRGLRAGGGGGGGGVGGGGSGGGGGGNGRCCQRQDLLKGLENCLRSYSVQWLDEFMDCGGLDLLLDYLGRTLDSLISSEEPLLNGHSGDGQHQFHHHSQSSKRSCWRRLSMQCSSSGRAQLQQQQQHHQSGGQFPRQLHQHQQLQLQQAQPDESLLSDLHNGVKCMRVLFNNQRACQRTFQDKTAVSIIARCIVHPRYATKTLVLELLAALCMLDGMHAQVLDAFDSLRERVGERRRWETLMTCFRRHEALPAEQYSLEFMVSCARFINIVQNVSNDEQLGLRVCLQAEFAQLGLEEFLRGLHGKYGDERLNSQIEAIFDNTIDVAGLFIDSVAKQAAVARAAALEEELYQAQDRQRRAEDEAAQIMAELRERLQTREADCATLQADKERALEQMQHSLRAASHSAGERERQLERTVRELEARLRDTESALKAAQEAAKSPAPPPLSGGGGSGSGVGGIPAAKLPGVNCSAGAPPPPPPTAPPPPPPPPPAFGVAPAAPAGVAVRQPVIPKHRLPLLNWTAIPPSGCRGTVFMDMNDEKARRRIDVDDFEDKFKLSAASGPNSDAATAAAAAAALKTKKERPTLLGHDRFRNLAVTRHKVESMRLTFAELAAAVDSLDADKVSADLAEILLRQGVPTDDEVRAYRRYEFAEGKRIDALSEPDQLLVSLCRVPMLERKLQALRYAGQFEENFAGVEPPLRAVIAASMALEKSAKFKKVLELILALGNYLNSHKRGLIYGFRLCSLASLQDTKSGDRKWTLLHFLVELVDQQFPDLANFEADLRHCEKAASVNLDNVRADAAQLVSGLEQLRSLANETNSNRLRDFLSVNTDRVERLKTDLKTAEECFGLVKTRFGEGMQQVASDAFFGVLHRFQCDVAKARLENDQRRAAAAELERASGKRKDSEDLSQQRRSTRKHTRTIEDGALDDIMSDFSRGALLVDDGLRRKRKTARDRLPQIRSAAAATAAAAAAGAGAAGN